MDMTRRAFLTHPLQAVREDMDRAGLWIRRAAKPRSGAGRSAIREQGKQRGEPGVADAGVKLLRAAANVRREMQEPTTNTKEKEI